MKTNGSQTYWGQNFDDSTSTKINRLLGYDDVLHKHATDGTEEQKRIEARRILEEDDNANLNARQLILKAKGSHGAGLDPNFPTQDEIEADHLAGTLRKQAAASTENTKETQSDNMAMSLGGTTPETPVEGGRPNRAKAGTLRPPTMILTTWPATTIPRSTFVNMILPKMASTMCTGMVAGQHPRNGGLP